MLLDAPMVPVVIFCAPLGPRLSPHLLHIGLVLSLVLSDLVSRHLRVVAHQIIGRRVRGFVVDPARTCALGNDGVPYGGSSLLNLWPWVPP
jgi:hypothetical protein